MNWIAVALLAVAVVAFVLVRIRMRAWIVDRWLEGSIGNRRAAVLLVITILIPMVIVISIAAASDPSSAPTLLLLVVLVGAPLFVLGIVSVQYAAGHGVKEWIQRSRQANLRGQDRPEDKTDAS